MSADFLALAMEWRALADGLRARGVPETDPALSVWREAAWCHTLVERGLHAHLLTRLLPLAHAVTGRPVEPGRPATEADAVAAAAELFGRLRAVVSTRHPGVFGRRAA
jgi:hypothetical protein